MTSGKSEIVIRSAATTDLDAVKCLADEYRYELGFVLRPALAKSIEQSELLVAENSKGIVGFVEYHHRRDEQTTLYHIAVQHDHRQLNIGRQLVEALLSEARQHGKSRIQLKCPVDLEANEFYERLGFTRVEVQPGKGRSLVVWRFGLD